MLNEKLGASTISKKNITSFECAFIGSEAEEILHFVEAVRYTGQKHSKILFLNEKNFYR